MWDWHEFVLKWKSDLRLKSADAFLFSWEFVLLSFVTLCELCDRDTADCICHWSRGDYTLKLQLDRAWDEFKAGDCIIQVGILDWLHFWGWYTQTQVLLIKWWKVAYSNLQIQQWLNAFSCSEINLTLQYYTHNRPSHSHTSSWTNPQLWYKLSAEIIPKESIISQASEEPAGSISDRYLSALTCFPSTSWAYLGHTATQIPGGGSQSFQRDQTRGTALL